MATEAREKHRLVVSEMYRLYEKWKILDRASVTQKVNECTTGDQRYTVNRIFQLARREGYLVEEKPGKYKIGDNIVEAVFEAKVWEALKHYDRLRQHGKPRKVDVKPVTPTILRQPEHRQKRNDLIMVAVELKRQFQEIMKQIPADQMVEQVADIKQMMEQALQREIQLKEKYAEVERKLQDCIDDTLILKHERDQLLQENRTLHAKLNGEGNE